MPHMARRHLPHYALMGMIILFAGCGNDGPGPYGYYGGACRGDYDCPPGSYCVDPSGGVCLPACRTDADCGPAYACKSQGRHGVGGKVDVCVVR
jgi:hypothetical protein